MPLTLTVRSVAVFRGNCQPHQVCIGVRAKITAKRNENAGNSCKNR